MTEPDMPNDEDKEKTRLLLEKGSRRVSMLAFHRGDLIGPEGVNNNGTVSFIKFPGGKYLVTNYHVWDAFRNYRNNDPTFKLLITGEGLSRPIDISDAEVVSESAQLDLCVLSYPPERIEVLGKEFVDPTIWPPERPKEADDVLIIGYPGKRRSVRAMSHPELGEKIEVLHHESIFLSLKVIDVSDRKAMLGFENTNPEITNFSNYEPTFRWNGMSGSLVYRADWNINKFVPCGIMDAAGEGLNAWLFLIYLDFIKSDGHIASV